MILEFELRVADKGYGPESFLDKRGYPVDIRELKQNYLESLIEFYKNFDMDASFNGLPPLHLDLRKAWLQSLLREGINLVSIMNGSEVIGHASLLELPARRSCEFLVAVKKKDRNNGVGTKLCQAVIKWAKSLRYRAIWLVVSNSNNRAIHVYKKVGFHVLSSVDGELEMEVEIK